MSIYDKIVLEVVGYDKTHWQVRYPYIMDECFWIPKESSLASNISQELRKNEKIETVKGKIKKND